MKKLLLSAVSGTAILLSAGAYADDTRTSNEDHMPHVTKEDVKEGWKNTKEGVSEAANEVSEATKKAYGEIKSAILNGDDVTKTHAVTLEEKMTASYIIGQPVLNDKNERVAKVNDIIIDKDGDAEMLILGDGNFTGWGKNVAYDFDRIVVKGQDGVVLSNLTEAMIDEAENFSYDQADASDKNTQVISQSSYSLSNLIGHNLTDQKGEVLANIEEVIVNDGEVDGLVVGYNETLGMGGDRAVLSLDDVMLSNHNGEVHAQLSVEKAARFNVFKNKQAESEM